MFCNCMILIRLRYFSSFRITYDYTPPLPSPKGETGAGFGFPFCFIPPYAGRGRKGLRLYIHTPNFTV
jgi:hypothetical protein